MFDNNSKVDCYQYSISLDRPIGFFCSLIFEMAEASDPKVPLNEVFSAEFYQNAGIRFETATDGSLNYSTEEVISFVATYFNGAAFEDLNKLSNSNILLVNKPQKSVHSYGDESDKDKTVQKTLTNFLKSYDVFSKLIDNIQVEGIKNVLSKLKSLRYDEHYGRSVSVTEKEDFLAPYLPYDFLNPELIEQDLLDAADLWINLKKFKSEFGIEISQSNDVFVVKSKPQESGETVELGVQYGRIFFPADIKEIREFLKPEVLGDFYWLMFKDVYKKGVSRGNTYQNDLLDAFKADMENAHLTKILSNLTNNHYLENKATIEGTGFEKYFEEVSKLTSLKHIDDFEFFVTNVKGKTALGIYSQKKLEKNYNLLHWVSTNDADEKHHHYKNEDKPEIKKRYPVYALQPVIAFYFISKFFEDLLDKAIAEISTDYIKNFELFFNGKSVGEIDFLIRTPDKLCFIEAKTKLTDEYIEQFILKCDHLMRTIGATDLKIEFYLLSAFSDATCERKKYFIDRETKEDYNLHRDGLKSKPYYFKVPIPQHPDLELTCISEPEFEKLKGIIQSICQK